MKPEESNPAETPPASSRNTDPWISGIESYARDQPTKAVSAAFGAGLILALVPIGGVLRLLFSALRPVLVILGLVKIWEEFGTRRRPDAAPSEKEEKH
jgi:hypothetical protein